MRPRAHAHGPADTGFGHVTVCICWKVRTPPCVRRVRLLRAQRAGLAGDRRVGGHARATRGNIFCRSAWLRCGSDVIIAKR
eukprot:7379760-Prymnesium_polylepis.3